MLPRCRPAIDGDHVADTTTWTIYEAKTQTYTAEVLYLNAALNLSIFLFKATYYAWWAPEVLAMLDSKILSIKLDREAMQVEQRVAERRAGEYQRSKSIA